MKDISTIRLIIIKSLNLIFIIAFFCTVTNLISPATFCAEGFGSRKLRLFLYPKQPPKVFPPSAKFIVQIHPQAIVNQENVRLMQERLVKTLAGYDLRFNQVNAKPDIIISCVIPELNAFSTYETHYTLEQSGDLSADTDVKSPLGSTLQPYTLTVLEGHLTVIYSARETATGKTFDSDTLKLDFKQGYERNPPKITDLYDLLIDHLAHMVASRFVPDFHSVEVPLAKGKLKHASELLQKGYWNSAIAELNALSQLGKADEEALRLYTMGVAYEGLAYETPYLNPTREYLEQALKYYEEAKRHYPAEATFQLSLNRVSNLLDDYRRIEVFIKAYERYEHQKELETSLISKIQERYGKVGFINNNTVISMTKSALSEKEILNNIENVKSRYFDLTPNGMTALTKAGVKAPLIDAMRESMRGIPYDGKNLRKWSKLPLDSILAVYPYLLIR
jgi:tetratricopeptide (TPR) repeat protein